MIVKSTTLAAALMACVFTGTALAQDVKVKPQGVNPVVAMVNGEAIHLSDVEEARELLPTQMQSAPLEAVYGMLTDSLINVRLAAAKAKTLGLEDNPEYKLRLTRISNRVLERLLLTQHIEKRLTEALVQDRYVKLAERVKDKFELHARHILLNTESEAKDIIAKLGKGSDFADLAKKHSTGPSGPKGGDLGWFGPGRMVKPFDDKAQALEVGTYTKKPVKTQFGWHVILVEERRPMAVPGFAEARSMLVNELSTELGQDLMNALRTDASVRKTPYQDVVKTLQQ